MLIKLTLVSILLFVLPQAALALDQIQIIAPKRCMFGDFDLMAHDHITRKTSNILLSVLNLETTEEKTFSVLRDVFSTGSKQEIESGVAAFFKNGERVKLSGAFSNDGNYLILVCNDQSTTRSCLNKKVEDIGKLMLKYQNPTEKIFPEDVVYFAQIINKRNKNFTFPTEAISQDSLSLLPELAKRDQNWKLKLRTISSTPLSLAKDVLQISLPVFSPTKCSLK